MVDEVGDGGGTGFKIDAFWADATPPTPVAEIQQNSARSLAARRGLRVVMEHSARLSADSTRPSSRAGFARTVVPPALSYARDFANHLSPGLHLQQVPA